MTKLSSTTEITDSLNRASPGCVIDSNDREIIVKTESLLGVASHLKNTQELNFNYLNWVTAVDYPDYFEVVYNFVSLDNNITLIVKTRCADKENPSVPSLVGLWKGANLQEREIYDLMGIRFEGHPNMKRIFLWEDFQGHPLRKDFILE